MAKKGISDNTMRHSKKEGSPAVPPPPKGSLNLFLPPAGQRQIGKIPATGHGQHPHPRNQHNRRDTPRPCPHARIHCQQIIAAADNRRSDIDFLAQHQRNFTADNIAHHPADYRRKRTHQNRNRRPHIARKRGFQPNNGKRRQPQRVKPAYHIVDAGKPAVKHLHNQAHTQHRIKIVQIVQPKNRMAVNQQIAQRSTAHTAEKRHQHCSEKIKLQLLRQHSGGSRAGSNTDQIQNIDNGIDLGQNDFVHDINRVKNKIISRKAA